MKLHPIAEDDAAVPADTIGGNAGDNTLNGTSGDDLIRGHAGNDGLNGLDGNDTLTGGAGDDTLDGGNGTDTASFADSPNGVTAGFGFNVTGTATGDGQDTLLNIENITGSAFGDQIRGTTGSNVLLGGAGFDDIIGYGGNDTIDGGDGNDTINGDSGSDHLEGGKGNDWIEGGQYTGSGTDWIDGGAGDDRVVIYSSGAGPGVVGPGEVLNGGSGTDTLEMWFPSQLNSLDLKADSFELLAGSPMIDGDGTANVFDLSGATAAWDYMNVEIHGNGGDDVIMGVRGLANSHLYGEDGNDTIIGYGSENWIYGGTGNDRIEGRGALWDVVSGDDGNDTIIDGVTGDVLDGGNGSDTIKGGGGNDTITGDSGDDVLSGNSGNDSLDGGQGNDSLRGGDGDDSLTGGAGSDTLVGGHGADTFVYGQASDSSGSQYDTLQSFDTAADRIDLPRTVSAIDPLVAAGTLSTASFDADLTAVINASTLGAGHAVLYTPAAGDLAGETFLIIDMNGTAGYQSGADLVLHFATAHSLAALNMTDFV